MFSSLLRGIHDLSVITRGLFDFTQIPRAFPGFGKRLFEFATNGTFDCKIHIKTVGQNSEAGQLTEPTKDRTMCVSLVLYILEVREKRTKENCRQYKFDCAFVVF